jgi:hypothetical protein
METIAISRSKHRSAEAIHWKQLWSLTALYASIIIGWIAYQNYQPKLLVRFQFTDFTFLLTAAQAVILVVTPLVAGRLGDRYRLRHGHRLPIISSGISFAAMIFMAVAFTLLGNPGEIFKWILPILIVCWLIAMSIFTSPALSTIELFTPVEKLPRAMAVLTITGHVVYALEPVIVDIIDFVGAPLTFILGGAIVFLSGYALKKNSLSLFQSNGNEEPKGGKAETIHSSYALIFFAGVSVGIATSILFFVFPLVWDGGSKSSSLNDDSWVVAGVLLLSALLSWPASNLVHQVGIERSFWLSFVGISLTSVAVLLSSASIVVLPSLIAFAMAYTFLSVSSLPLAIRRSGFKEKVFCVGVFFSGVALPEGVFEVWSAWSA